jgi:spermidine synthase
MSENAEYPRPEHPVPFVHDENGCKSLCFSNDQLQSKMRCGQPDELVLEYTRTMMGFLLLNSRPKHIAMIGLGGGRLAKFCYARLAETKITVVEINPKVIALRNEFLVPEDNERFSVVEADGADFVMQAAPDFDVLLVDGYDQQGQSPQLSSQRFYENCSRVLADEGVMVVNLHEAHALYELFIDRIGRSFDHNMAEVVANRYGNVVVFAGKNIAVSPHALRSQIQVVQPPGWIEDL